nr:pseudouridine synthase [Candidatus Njordarchaeota archaeon]
MLKRASYWVLRKIRTIADYQFFTSAGSSLFSDEINVTVSLKTGKIKEIRENNIHIATLNPKNGIFSLSIEGARKLVGKYNGPLITVNSEFNLPILRGGNVFAKHIINAADGLRAGNEIIVMSEDSSLLAVGRSLVSGEEAKRFKYGVAIKVRRGVKGKHVSSKNGS